MALLAAISEIIASSDDSDSPALYSPARAAQCGAYDMIEAVLAGAASIRAAATRYLPQYPAEGYDEYYRRLNSAPWRPEFEDSLRGIASKPFSKPVSLQGTPSPNIKAFAEDVDTLGNDLHNFARSVFWNGIGFGMHGILVDHPDMKYPMSAYDERVSGARPYWCHITAPDILDLRTALVGGQTVVNYVRFRQWDERPKGRFGSEQVEQIKILTPGAWELWEKDKDSKWFLVNQGKIALPVIPLALFYTGRRVGPSHPRPPLTDLADMQLELYRALSREDEVLTYAGSPMLTANGMAAPSKGVIEIGPKRILFAPSSGGLGNTSWAFIQPDAANLAEIRAKVESIINDMRRLGLQPLMPRSGDVAATIGALEAAKAHSAAEAWANGLKDALEQALVFTAQWYNEPTTVEVAVHTDFGVDLEGGTDMDALLAAREAGEISRETYWDELLRRGRLGPQFDPKQEATRLQQEEQESAKKAADLAKLGPAPAVPGTPGTPPMSRPPTDASKPPTAVN